MNEENVAKSNPLPNSAKLYNSGILRLYDAYVLGFSNTIAWRCPTSVLLAHYNQCISSRHLDIGPGTGFFLDRCSFPDQEPKIDLLDINEVPLKNSSERIRRYQPNIHVGDIYDPPASLQGPFESIGLNYVLHCLPGTLEEKGNRFLQQWRPYLETGKGRIFGSTILGLGVQHNPIGQALMRIYNQKGIFGNQMDDVRDLEELLKAQFVSHTLEVRGCVALFAGYL